MCAGRPVILGDGGQTNELRRYLCQWLRDPHPTGTRLADNITGCCYGRFLSGTIVAVICLFRLSSIVVNVVGYFYSDPVMDYLEGLHCLHIIH